MASSETHVQAVSVALAQRYSPMQIAPARLRRLAMTSATLPPLTASLYVALGGAMGAVGRYQLGRALAHFTGPNAAFPWATLTANVAGSLAMGLLIGWMARHGGSETMRLLLGVGLLGGFTTFSAFSLELAILIERGQLGLGFAYAAASVLAGLAALFIGLYAMRGAM